MDERIPAFLLQQLSAQYDEADVQRICAGYDVRRRTTLRTNRLKADAETVASALAAAGIAFERAPWSKDAFILESGSEEAVQQLSLYETGGIYLQSLSSMLPPILLGAKAGENLLDMAAAPGGKTTQIASLTDNACMITACEMNKGRAERLRYNVERQGATKVTVMTADARNLDDFFRFDRILLDAPCSGSGTVLLGRTRGQFNKANLDKTTKAQSALLDKALRLLKPGCEMIYSTCSILRAENEDVLTKAMARHKAEIVPILPEELPGVPLLPTRLPGTAVVCPDEYYEGFFVARLRKIK